MPSARAHLRQLLAGMGPGRGMPGRGRGGLRAGDQRTRSVRRATASGGARAGMARIRWSLRARRRGRREPPASDAAEPGARRRGGPRAGAGGSVQQPVGMASGQHRRASESRLGGMAPADPRSASVRPPACRTAAMQSDQREQRSPLGLGPLETAIMQVMWEADSWLMVRDIRDRMDYAPVAYTTVARSPASCAKKTCSSAASRTVRGSLAQRPGGTGRPAR